MQVEQRVAEAATVEVERLRITGPKAAWGRRRHRARCDRLLHADRRNVARAAWEASAGCRLRAGSPGRQTDHAPAPERHLSRGPYLEADVAAPGARRLVTGEEDGP